MGSDEEIKKHEAALEALVLVHGQYLRYNPRTLPLSETDVSLVSCVDQEPWMTIPGMLASGRGDAEDIACWRAAELRAAGKKASVSVRRAGLKGYLYVVLVTEDGEVDLRDIVTGGRAP